jgi:hypothetical protein
MDDTTPKYVLRACEWLNEPEHFRAAEALLDAFLERWADERERNYVISHYED